MKRWIQTWAEDYRALQRNEFRKADRGLLGRTYTKAKPTMTCRVYRARENIWEDGPKIDLVDGVRTVTDGWKQPSSQFWLFRIINLILRRN